MKKTPLFDQGPLPLIVGLALVAFLPLTVPMFLTGGRRIVGWLAVAFILFLIVMALGKLGDALNRRRGQMYEQGRRREK